MARAQTLETPSHPWSRPPDTVIEALEAPPGEGLSSAEARRRLQRFGENRLRRIEQRSIWRILLEQVESLVVWLLFAAAVASAAFGQWKDAAAIGVVVVINTAIGFFTELRARRSMEALQRMGEARAQVLRDGEPREVAAAELVPGDVVFLEEGSVVPADLRLVEAEQLEVDESALTGESVPVGKQAEAVDDDVPLAERTSMAFKGTAVTRGSGKAVVVGTGMDTELGEVSAMVEEAEEGSAPIEKRLDHLARRLVWLTVVVAAAVTVVGVLAERDVFTMFETGVALAVAAIPEGLPIVATIALARGMHRMAARNALMRRLSSVETLGATNVICTDKTGTLTENRMDVETLAFDGRDVDTSGEAVETGEDERLRTAIEVAVLCTDAELGDSAEGEDEGSGDPMELALLRLGRKAGLERDALYEQKPQARLEPFDTDTKMMASFHEDPEGEGGAVFVAVKGAPEAVLEACDRVWSEDGRGRELTEDDRERWRERNQELAADGLRILALAGKRVDDAASAPYEGLELLGLVGMLDPPRAKVREALGECHRAGLRVLMVTGDQPATARYVARQVGLVDEDEEPVAIRGRDFESERERITEAAIFARVSPAQKLAIIDRHQDEGHVVAMTGDGVNDAPALKSADIGVAMGRRGTQVAQDAADMVLLDDAFETIVEAIHQGRVIFDNIRKFVVYLLSGNVGEILAVGAAAATTAPLPLLPLQILYLNMLNDVFPALALGVSPGARGVMRRPPRPSDEPLATRRQWGEIGGYGLVIGATVLGVFALALLWLELPTTQAVTVSFLTLSIGRLFHALNMRDPSTTLWDNGIVKNPWMWGAIALCVALLLLAVYLPPLASILTLSPPPTSGWLLILGGSLVPLVLGQIYLALRSVSRGGRSAS